MAIDRFNDVAGRGGDYLPPRRPFGSSGGGNSNGNGGGPSFPGRVPPHSIEAEMAVLGAMMLGDRAALERATEILTRDDFYRDAHSHLFDAMITLTEKDEPVDIVTLKDELGRRGILEPIGGIDYLMQLADLPFTTANIGTYAKTVQEKAILRRLIEATSMIQGMAFGQVEEISELIDKAERTIFEVGRRRDSQGLSPLRPLLSDAYEHIDTTYHEKGGVVGVDTGYDDLNYMTSGLQDGDLIIVAARPSMGKCVAWDTLIDDPLTGQRVTAEDYIRRELPLVSGLSVCGRVLPAAISHWIDSGVKPTFRVTTRTGRTVSVTGHHPFLTVAGWTPLHDLRVGDRIGVPRVLTVFGTDESLPLPLVRLMAYFMARGSLKDCPSFLITRKEVEADFQNIIVKHFPQCAVRQGFYLEVICAEHQECSRGDNPVTVWLNEFGGTGDAEDRRFPKSVWQWTRPLLAELLRALKSCVGLMGIRIDYPDRNVDSPVFEFCFPSSGLAEDVHHALVRFGVVSTLWHSELGWRVDITEPQSVELYNREIGWLTEGERRVFADITAKSRLDNQFAAFREQAYTLATKARELSLSALAWRGGENGRNDRIARTKTAILDSNRQPQIVGPDLYWDEIVAIEDAGKQQVYDLTVPDGANFIAQDICVHNTSLVLGIGQNACLRAGKTVAVFSLEMGKEQLVQRMICSEARVDAHRLRTGHLNNEDWNRLSEAVARLWDVNLFIDDSTDMTALEMRAKCRRLRAEHGLDLVIVDYLQLMRGGGKNESNRNEEITTISRGLKNLAREFKVPVIALSQLSRSVERREDKRPMLSDLRESGSIEAEADLVAFIYRPAYYERKETVSQETNEAEANQDRQGSHNEGEEAEIIIAKHRNGPTGTVKLSFLAKYARFDNLETRYGESPF